MSLGSILEQKKAKEKETTNANWREEREKRETEEKVAGLHEYFERLKKKITSDILNGCTYLAYDPEKSSDSHLVHLYSWEHDPPTAGDKYWPLYQEWLDFVAWGRAEDLKIYIDSNAYSTSCDGDYQIDCMIRVGGIKPGTAPSEAPVEQPQSTPHPEFGLDHDK